MPRPLDEPADELGTEADGIACASCGRPLGWDGLLPSRDGDRWICGECDAARAFDALDP